MKVAETEFRRKGDLTSRKRTQGKQRGERKTNLLFLHLFLCSLRSFVAIGILKNLRHTFDEKPDLLQDACVASGLHQALRRFVHRLVAHAIGAEMHRHEGL